MITEHQLPDPKVVEETLGVMRNAVMSAYRSQDEQIEAAQSLIEEAEAEKARLRETYPMFFSEFPSKSDGTGGPTVVVMNRVLRALAEHPGMTRSQLARHMSYSTSWVSKCVHELNANQPVEIIQYGKKGRLVTYTLTAAGNRLVDRGGLREA